MCSIMCKLIFQRQGTCSQGQEAGNMNYSVIDKSKLPITHLKYICYPRYCFQMVGYLH